MEKRHAIRMLLLTLYRPSFLGMLTSFGLTQKLFSMACFPRITGPQSDHELSFNLFFWENIVDVMLCRELDTKKVELSVVILYCRKRIIDA